MALFMWLLPMAYILMVMVKLFWIEMRVLRDRMFRVLPEWIVLYGESVTVTVYFR